ncbi:putative methyltransferase-domain-containing protein [Halteromyces radiatus]|uniref:putative methyltransferase-domain-containing protein n=1 Tax=Halteromyces radiatus TaxID=101107 RepID=UPI00221F1DEA|nr:putative methyltransferase-domain-containing protein [Halteromyces radiatus]KAI8098689.1 putative methyltransferase-domain-containing protein [Halteromyces radiatus]
MSSDEEDGFAGDLFGEDEETIIQVPNSTETYHRDVAFVKDNDIVKTFHIRLVGSHPLWAHHLWNASKVFASLFDQRPQLVQNKTILELGAGGALPSLVAAIHQPTKIVVTDYPDSELLENIQYNVDQNLGSLIPSDTVSVLGYIWGTSTDQLEAQLPKGRTTYDVIILSDLVFNHSQHHALLKTCRQLLTPVTGRVYVFYTHHRPHLAHRDLEFFKIAERPVLEQVDPDDRDAIGYGFKTDHFITKKMHVMFEEDPGDEQVRATVHGWQMWLP